MKFIRNVLFCLLLGLHVQAQHQIALPQIINYHNYDYKAGVQNWAIEQGSNGLLYFGNSEGLLVFDGKFWKRYQIPNKTVIRSIKVCPRGRIYIGGQGEIGYFFPDKTGQLVYHSLNGLLPVTERIYPDIWNIVLLQEEVFFRTRHKIFHLKDDVIRIYKPETKWDFLGEAHQRVYAQQAGKGLLVFDNGIWKPVCQHPVLNESPVASMLSLGQDSILVATTRNGLYLLQQNTLTQQKTAADGMLINDRIYCMSWVNKDWMAVGTNGAGILILDRAGKLIQTYSYQEGLQKNNIRALGLDRNKNLWVGLDDGIDQIAINSAVKYIYPDPTKQVTGYATRLFHNKLYIGTSNGLYASTIDPAYSDLSLAAGAFTKVNNTSGQVWNLEEINDHLLVAHEDGGLVVRNNEATKMHTSIGSWLFRPVSPVFPTAHVLVGTYTGLSLVAFQNNRFQDLGHLNGVMESLRFMSFDNDINVLWASHPNLGIYKIQLSSGFTHTLQSQLMGKQYGLPADNGNYIFRIKNRIVVTSLDGIYEYDTNKNRFMPSVTLHPIFKGMSLQYLHEDRVGNLWFVTNKRLGVVDFHRPSAGKSYTIEYFPELNGTVLAGYESIYSLNEENIFIAANKGIIHLNYKKYCEQISRPDVLIGQVRLPLAGARDSILFGGHALVNDTVVAFQRNQPGLQLPASLNSLHFEYASTLFDQLRTIEFNYKLEGFDHNWSGWSTKSEKDYTNLPPGEYTFTVKSRNSKKNESAPVQYHFEVMRAWYNNYLTYALYIGLLASAIYYIFRWQQQKHQKAQRQLNYLHQLELDRNEKEIVQLKNEKLESDLSFKNRELLTMTINLVQRGEVLTRIRESVTALIKKDVSGERSLAYRNLLRLIREVEKSNEDWDQFAIHFNNVNIDFFNTLKQAYPDLTPNDLKLCAYLRMNLSSKEIAQLLNITVKGVEVARYRLRKKLQLLPDTNLTEFLSNLPREDANA